MRIDWLDDLIALLDTGSVVEAAASRNISQSAFSRRIQALETLLDIELIDRRSKPNRPAGALRNHQEQMRQMSRQQRSLIKQMQTESRSGSSVIVVASQHAITASLGPQIVKLVSALGKAHVRLRSANLNECEALLLTGQADFSITYRLAADNAGKRTAMTEEAFMANETLIPVYDAKTAKQMLWRFHMGDLDLVAYPSDVFLGNAIERHIFPRIEHQCRLNIVAETALTLAAMQMATEGLGVAWVPEALAQADLRTQRLAEFSELFGSLDMHIVAGRRSGDMEELQSSIWNALSREGAVVTQ
ncbi:LysR family transcriptional regulator [Hoeflea sp.]|uniref:LysR family transcriptional regulator n=1 Tax=Hoeflea sp. TaxID=1940281 RepID=UPI003B01AE45